MQFSHAPSLYPQFNSFDSSQAFSDLKELYECDINISGPLHHSNSTPNRHERSPKRTKTGPANTYFKHLNPIEQYVFLEPLVSLFGNTRIRISSMDQRSTDDLAYSYKFKFTLKDMKKKCDINLQIVLEDLKKLYSTQNADNIKTLLTCMTQLAAAYMLSSLNELRAGRCKYILEKLSEIENIVYKYLETISAKTKSHTNLPENAEIEPILRKVNSNRGENTGYGDLLGVSGAAGLSGSTKLQYITTRNTKRAESVLNDKLSHKEALKILARMKYVIAQSGRLLHYESIANATVTRNQEKPALQKSESESIHAIVQGVKLEQKFFTTLAEDLDDETVALKKQFLQKFWHWKLFKWKMMEPTIPEKKHIYKILCPICEKEAKLDQGKQHLELCKERAELNNRLVILDNKLSDVVFQAFKSMKTIQKSLVVDSKKYSKFQAKLNTSMQTPSLRSREISHTPSSPNHASEFQVQRCRSEDKVFSPANSSIKRQPRRRLCLQPSRSKEGVNETEEETKSPNPKEFKLTEQYAVSSPTPIARIPALEDNTLDDNTLDQTDEIDSSPILPLKNKSPYFTNFKINTGKPVFDALCRKANDNNNRRASAQVKAATPSERSSDNGGETGFSGFQSDNGSDSLSEPYSIDSPRPERGSRSKSVIHDLIPDGLPKKSRFFMGRAALQQNIQEDDEEDESVIQSHDNIEKLTKNASILRKAKTIADELEMSSPLLFKKKESRSELKGDQGIAEKIKRLKAIMTHKKLKVKIYDRIHKKGKAMLNQQAYHKEMEWLREEITISIQELVEKSKSDEVWDFAENFISILEKRIEVGNELDIIEKKLCKLEGKPKKHTTTKLEPLLRHKSSLPLSSPRAMARSSYNKASENSPAKSTNRFIWDLNGTGNTGKRFSFRSREEKEPFIKLGSKEDHSTDSIILPDDLSLRPPTQSISQDEVIMHFGEKGGSQDNLVPSLWDTSLPEIHNPKTNGSNDSLGNCGLTHMPSHDTSKPSFASSRNLGGLPSITINDMPFRANKGRNITTLELHHETSSGLSFERRDSKRSHTTPHPFSVDTDGPDTPKMQRILATDLLGIGEIMGKDKHHLSRESSFSRGASFGEGRNHENGLPLTNKRTALNLEKVEEYDQNLSPSLLIEDDDEVPRHKKSLTMIQPSFKDIKTPKNNEDIEVDSFSSIGSAINDRGYFSDSEARNPNRTLKSHSTVGIEEFEPIKMISKGAFGRVWLVRKKATKDVYAMKVINLAEKLMKNKDLENLRKESNVFSIAQEEFLVRAVFTFTHETCICFVMEYMLGGDLADLLYNYGALEEDTARFYIAELIQAVEYLHSVGIVHRDLKPDNILLDKSGHAKLTDFGLSEVGLSQKIRDVYSPLTRNRSTSKFSYFDLEMARKAEGDNDDLEGSIIPLKTHESKEIYEDPEALLRVDSDKNKRKVNRLIGTPDYMAPEIINNVTITSYSSDWWSVGVILFELIVGIPPFNDESPEKIFENILAMKIPWDDIPIGYGEGQVTPEAEDLIKKLLNPDHLQRLGANGAKEIKEHPFFKNTNWEKLRSQKAPVTFDHVKDTDTQNFVRMQDQITAKESHDPFVLIPKGGDVAGNMQAAKQFIETAQENFRMVNITALYSAGLKLTEETMKEKAKELELMLTKETIKPEVVRKFNDVFEIPE